MSVLPCKIGILRGGEGHGHFKLYLAEVLWEYFRPYP